MTKSKGRPFGTSSKYISIETLLQKLGPKYCVPINDSFIRKYNLLETEIKENLCETEIKPQEKVSQVQIQEINLSD